jgi:hypothetical protein
MRCIGKVFRVSPLLTERLLENPKFVATELNFNNVCQSILCDAVEILYVDVNDSMSETERRIKLEGQQECIRRFSK